MPKFNLALQTAKNNGHDMQNDPPVFASVNRYTCSKCGRTVLGNSSIGYGGSAAKNKCEPEAEEENGSKK